MKKGTELPPTILVIFGITGDLSHRYLLPALAQIEQTGILPKDFKIVGVSRRNINSKKLFTKKEQRLRKFTQIIQMNLSSDESYKNLGMELKKISSSMSTKPQIIYYFAVPPAATLPIIRHLGRAKLNTAKSKLLLEKPFGVDLESARELVYETEKYFPESQIYRIDHYLAKEMAQNIAVFIGSNVLFQNIWHRQSIEYIEIVAAEEIGIEGRIELWESTGALRDFLQSHLLQLAALTLMEPCPHDFDFAGLPKRRLAALQQLSVAPDELDQTVFRAQYDGYREEVKNHKSLSDTFVAVQLNSSNSRWRGVPIYLACGKKLNQKLTQIRINFKSENNSETNMLILRIQPKEGIELDLWVKQPGYERKLQKKTLSFSYEQDFRDRLPNAYEQILIDAVQGSQSLFASSDEVIESWRILQPIQSKWEMDTNDLSIYKPGSTIEEVIKAANSSL